MNSIIKKLDLDGYIEELKKYFARDKSIILQGDIKHHFKYIEALSNSDYPVMPQMINLDSRLMRIKKQAVLGLDEIYAFTVMVSYFNRLKTIEFEAPLKGWLEDIQIPKEINEIISFFTEEGNINPAKDRKLFGLEKAIKENKKNIKESLYKLTHSTKLQDYLVDTQIHFNNGEETLLVRGGFNNVLKASVIGRSSGGFFYIIPQSITYLKEKEAMLLSDKEQLIYDYCKQFSATFFEWEKFLNFLNRAFDTFDHYQARVSFARNKDFVFVLPSKGKEVILEEFAHPAIENPIPVSISLDKEVMLITGVNAGGKTMLLKSLLASVFMSKYLLPFRCNIAKTKIGHYKSIDAIIDDPQSVKNDISTFAGRMQEFSKLFKKERAIVGVDEIELGTDSDEAATLFRVLLNKLRKKEITFIVTTHHKRLASLMASDEQVSLIAAIYDEENRLPTYTFLQGSIGKSYAFETALRYGIPEALIEEAKVLYGEDKENLNKLIERSTNLEREMRTKIISLEEKQEEVDKKRLKLENQKERFEEEHKAKVYELEKKYNEAIKKAQEAIKVQESKEGRRLLNLAHKEKTVQKNEVKEEPKRELKEGDKVKYRSHTGELVSIRGKQATILVDGLKMRVPSKELKFKGEIPKVAKKEITKVSVEKSNTTVSIKLLGLYADEAIDEVDRFISNALIHNLNEVQIIHGTGTGVLAKVVSDYLKQHPKISGFYRMKGNLGVTIVEL